MTRKRVFAPQGRTPSRKLILRRYSVDVVLIPMKVRRENDRLMLGLKQVLSKKLDTQT